MYLQYLVRHYVHQYISFPRIHARLDFHKTSIFYTNRVAVCEKNNIRDFNIPHKKSQIFIPSYGNGRNKREISEGKDVHRRAYKYTYYKYLHVL